MNKYRVTLISAAAICLTLVCAFLLTGQVQASPAAPGEFVITQPDGTTFTAQLWGDEWNHGYETTEGYTILKQTDGWWVYAELQSDGLLGSSMDGSTARKVGIDSPEELSLNLRPSVLRENPNSPTAMSITSPLREAPKAPALTNVKTLVLLADFNNIVPAYTAASFQALMFSTTSSSVRKFYRDTSFNNLDIIPAEETCGTANDGITDWTALAYAHPNTGESTDYRNADIVKNVLVANNSCIDFASFDTNTNGYIDASELSIVVVVAGWETSYGGAAYSYTPNIWAHQWDLNSATGGVPQLDGKYVGDGNHGGYAQFGERHGDTISGTTHQATIGIMAHEYGHIINWPDLYDTDYSSEGVGDWSIMAGGSWNGISYSGDSPAMADAWLKWYQGWITPTEITGTVNNQAIAQAETNATAFLLRPNPSGVDWSFYSHSGTGEFFLVENRQYSGYDAGLPGCGLLIWHIDESVTNSNSANANEDHALVWLEQADGLNSLYYGGAPYSDAGDPYPGSTSNYNFSSVTTPNSNLYGGSASNVSVHVDSTTCSSSMQADLTYIPPAPGAFSKTSPANTAMGQPASLVLNWADSSGVSYYEYCVDAFADGSCAGSWYNTGAASQVGPLSFSVGLTYEWQVRANDGVGGTTYANSGVTWTFTTSATPLDQFTYLPLIMRPVDPPAAFGKSSPANGATGVSTTPTLDWADATGAVSYEYCYDTTVNGSCTGTWTSTGATSQVTTPTLAYSTPYEWQVRARNPGGITEANAGTEWSFTTMAAAGAWTTIMTENFEGSFPSGWALYTSGDGYAPGKRTCRPYAGSNSGWMTGGGASGTSLPCGSNYTEGVNSWMVYGPFNTVGSTAAELNFQHWVYLEGDAWDTLCAWASNDDITYNGYCFWGNYSTWNSFTLDLSNANSNNYLGLSNVWVAFTLETDIYSVNYPEGAYVDNIILRKCTTSSCTGAPELYSIGGNPIDAIKYFLDPFVLKFSRPSSIIRENR